jgi:hypothetical protein
MAKAVPENHIPLNNLRNQLRIKGYGVIPCHGKVPAIKFWNSVNYIATQLSDHKKGSAAERVESWPRRFPVAKTTGIRIERGVLTNDFDTDDAGAIDACTAALSRISPFWDTAPTRFGGGQFKMAVFGRVVEEQFVRVASAKFRRPGDDAEQYHHVEIFGGKPFRSGVCSRQFACYGPRSYAEDGSVESEYVWAEGLPQLHEVTVDELPGMTRDQALGVIEAFEAYAKVAGWAMIEKADETDGEGADIFDIDPETSKFEVRGEASPVSYATLEAMVFTTSDLRVTANFIPGEVSSTPDRCSVYWSKRFDDCICIKDWKTNNRHYPKDKAPPGDAAKTKIAATVTSLMADAQKAAKTAAAAGERSGEADDKITPAPSKMPPQPRNLTEEERRTKDNDLRGELIGERVHWLLQTHAYERGNVVNIYTDAFSRHPDGLSERAARSAFLNWTITRNGEGRRGGNLPPISALDIWLGDEYRMKTAGVQMRPDRAFPAFIDDDGLIWRNRYKAPRHYEVKVTQAQITEAKDLIHLLAQNIAAAPEETKYLLQHVSYKMQHPEVPGCGILFVNPVFGSGRDLFFSIISVLLGETNCTKQDISKLIGKDGRIFNAWVANKVLTYVPEVLDVEHARGTYERLKSLVDPRSGLVSVNIKGVEEFDGIRFSSVWFATNHTDALRIEDDDRRLSVLLGRPQQLEEELAARLERWRLAPGSTAALWHYLKGFDLAGYQPHVPLKTAAKLNMIEDTKDPVRVALQAIADDEHRAWKAFTLDQLEAYIETWLGIGTGTRADKTRNLTVRHKAARAGLVVPVPGTTVSGLQLRVQGKPKRIYAFRHEADEVAKMMPETVQTYLKDGPVEMEHLRKLSEEAAAKKKGSTSDTNVLNYPRGEPSDRK